MKLITRDTDYAIRAICYIAKEKDRLVAASVLVKKLKIPRPFLRKILQSLNNAGVLRSYKGQGGGFLLNRTPKEIKLLDLINIFQGPIKLSECFFKKKICPNTALCPLKAKVDKIQQKIISDLKTITIASLLRR